MAALAAVLATIGMASLGAGVAGAATLVSTTTILGATPSAATWSSSSSNTVKLTTLTLGGTVGTPVTGTVTFTAGSATLCKDVALASDSATCMVPADTLVATAPTAATPVTVTATYNGNSTYASSKGSVVVDVSPPVPPTATTTSVTATPAELTTWSSSSSDTVVLNAIVGSHSLGGGFVSAGSVTFTAGTTTLCKDVAFKSDLATCTVTVDKLFPSKPTTTTAVTVTGAYAGGTSSAGTVYAGSKGTATVTYFAPIGPKQLISYDGSISGWSTGNFIFSGSAHTPNAAYYGMATASGYAPPFTAATNATTMFASANAGATALSAGVGAVGQTVAAKTGTGHPPAAPIEAWTGSGEVAQIGTASEAPSGVALGVGPVSWSSTGAVSATASWGGGTGTIDLAQGLSTLTVGSWTTWEPIFGPTEPTGITSSSTLTALLAAEGYTPDIVLSDPTPAVTTVEQSGSGANVIETMHVPAYGIELFPTVSGSGQPLATISYPPATVTYTQLATTITDPLPAPTVTVSGAPTLTTNYPAGTTTTTENIYQNFLAGGLLSQATSAYTTPLYTNHGTAINPDWVQTGWGYDASPTLVEGLNGAQSRTGPQGCVGLCLQTPMTTIGAGAAGLPGLQVASGSGQQATVGQVFGKPLVASVTSGTKPDLSAPVAFHIVPGTSGASATFRDPSSDPLLNPLNLAASTATTWYASSGSTGSATSGALRSNGIPGTFTVVASLLQSGSAVPAQTAPVTFTLTNLAPPTPAPTPAPAPTKTATTTAKPAPAPVVVKLSGFVAEKVPPDTIYPHRLQATVTRDGQPVEGYQVTFHLAADSGLTFDGPPVLTATALTNAQGVATSPPIRAGSTVGTFVAAATASGSSGTASGTVGQLAVVQPPYGYRMVGADGGVFDFHVPFYGSAANIGPRSGNMVGLADAATGYWLATSNGGVLPVGGAPHLGSLACHGCAPYHGHIVGIAATPGGAGYWLVGAGGGVYAFGDAGFYGSMGGKHLNAPVVGMASTPGGHGYWLAAADGGVFAFGSARFYGSMGGKVLNKLIVGIAATQGGHGYWLVGADGGVFAFGSAAFHGSTGAIRLNEPVVGIVADPATGGYWLLGSDGGVFAFHAPFYGSMGGTPLNRPVVAGTAVEG